MTYVDPLIGIARASSLLQDSINTQANRRSGARLAQGDYRGAAQAQFGAGNLDGGQAIIQDGQQAATTAREDAARSEAEQIAFTRQAVRALRESQDPLTEFDRLAPAFRQMGTDDAQIGQLRQGLQTGGRQFLDSIEQIAETEARKLQIQNLGNGYGVAIDEATGQIVNEYRAPAGIKDANGVIYNDQTGAILQDTRPPEYIQRDREKDLIEITPGGMAQPPADGRQPRGVRNNNPGNIEDGPFAKSLPGYAGSDGRFAIFDSPEQGAAAKTRLLQSYVQRGFDTPAEIINRWAPPSDNNPTGAYVAYVARRAGLGPNDKVTPDKIELVAQAIAEFENGNTQRPSSGGPRVVAEGTGPQQTPAQAAASASRLFTQERQLRTEFGNNPAVKTLATVRPQVRIIGDIAQRAAAGERVTAQDDLALIFSYMKMLDPGSVVREGEFANAQNTAGIPERVVNAYNNALRGTRLSDQQRANFFQSATGVMRGYQAEYETAVGRSRGLAESYGLEADRVAPAPPESSRRNGSPVPNVPAEVWSTSTPQQQAYWRANPPRGRRGAATNPYRLRSDSPRSIWDSIPSGAHFIHPDGTVRTKP